MVATGRKGLSGNRGGKRRFQRDIRCPAREQAVARPFEMKPHQAPCVIGAAGGDRLVDAAMPSIATPVQE
jgi:hypothetical protein